MPFFLSVFLLLHFCAPLTAPHTAGGDSVEPLRHTVVRDRADLSLVDRVLHRQIEELVAPLIRAHSSADLLRRRRLDAFRVCAEIIHEAQGGLTVSDGPRSNVGRCIIIAGRTVTGAVASSVTVLIGALLNRRGHILSVRVAASIQGHGPVLTVVAGAGACARARAAHGIRVESLSVVLAATPDVQVVPFAPVAVIVRRSVGGVLAFTVVRRCAPAAHVVGKERISVVHATAPGIPVVPFTAVAVRVGLSVGAVSAR